MVEESKLETFLEDLTEDYHGETLSLGPCAKTQIYKQPMSRRSLNLPARSKPCV